MLSLTAHCLLPLVCLTFILNPHFAFFQWIRATRSSLAWTFPLSTRSCSRNTSISSNSSTRHKVAPPSLSRKPSVPPPANRWRHSTSSSHRLFRRPWGSRWCTRAPRRQRTRASRRNWFRRPPRGSPRCSSPRRSRRRRRKSFRSRIPTQGFLYSRYDQEL